MIWFLAAFSSEEVSSTYALISIVEGGNKVAQLDETPNWHGLGGAIAAHETSRSSLHIAYLRVVDCRIPRSVSGRHGGRRDQSPTDPEAI